MRKWSLLFSLAVLLQACAFFQRATPANVYLLEPVVTPASVSLPAGRNVLLVAPTLARPGYEVAAIAYAEDPLRLDYYAYNRWADQPAKLIEAGLIKALESGGGFRAVLNAASSARATLRLDTELISLRHELLTQPSTGRIVLRAQLTDINNARVLATHVFEHTSPAETPTPRAGVAAMATATAKVLAEISAFCANYANQRLEQ